ncbi:MAG: aldo/keto reductase [Pseudonocardiales bacterium]|nr:MAG: aldo/keto reductase [Pseudonocardiales bacterium]
MTSRTPHDLTAGLSGGARIPLLGFGTWQIRGEQARQAVGWALEAGCRHIDTATMYRNEADVGAGIAASGLPREELFLTTKIQPHSAGQEQRTLRQSLDALGTDHLDLWLVHWPPADGVGAGMWRRLIEARDQGLARSIGVSNYSLDQLDRLGRETGIMAEVNQIEWSPFLYDRAVAEGHRERGIVLEGYSPFRASKLDHPALTAIAERHGRQPAQVIVRWHLQHGFVVIPKSAHKERIEANVEVGDFELTDDDMRALDGLGRP